MKAVCGEDGHKKVADLSAAGVTAQQADAVKTAFGAEGETAEDTDKGQRAQILGALEEAHSDSLPPGGNVAGTDNPLIADAKRRAGQ